MNAMKYNIETKYNIKVLANRPVSLHCNSGETLHLPPSYSYEIAGEELIGNSSFEKLVKRKLLSVNPSENSKPEKQTDSGSRKSKSRTGKNK